MRVYNDSIFGPNSSFSLSVTRDTVDAFDTTPRIPSPSPSVRATRKTASKFKASQAWQLHSFDYKARVTKLGAHGRRVMQYYAGNTSEAQLRTLEKLEQYELSHRQSPIAPIGKEGPRGGESQLKWECRICNMIFPTFQKVAVHLTSREWCLPNWRCPDLLCARIYQSRNELNRHEKSHLSAGRKKSPAASGRSAQQSVPSILQPAKDEKHPPPVTPVQVARHSDTDPSIQVTSRRQMSSPPTTTFVDCNCPGCPSQGIRQNSCDSKISDSLQLGGPGYLTTEPAPLHTLSESSVFDWAAPNGVSLPMREMGPRPLVKGALNPDHFSVEGLYSADSIPSNILLQHQSNSIDINQPATIDQCYFPQPGDLLQPRFVSTLLPILSGNTLTDSSMAPAYRTHYLFHESLADTFLTQDLTRNYDLPHNWPHYGADLETFVSSQETGHDLELASAHINHALNDSHCRLTPNKYHNHPTQFATASLEMDTTQVVEW